MKIVSSLITIQHILQVMNTKVCVCYGVESNCQNFQKWKKEE